MSGKWRHLKAASEGATPWSYSHAAGRSGGGVAAGEEAGAAVKGGGVDEDAPWGDGNVSPSLGHVREISVLYAPVSPSRKHTGNM